MEVQKKMGFKQGVGPSVLFLPIKVFHNKEHLKLGTPQILVLGKQLTDFILDSRFRLELYRSVTIHFYFLIDGSLKNCVSFKDSKDRYLKYSFLE